MSGKRVAIPLLVIFCCVMVFGSCAPTEARSGSFYKRAASSAKKAAATKDTEREQRAKQKYFEAEACYTELKSDSKRKKFRCYWMECIHKFEESNRIDPSGPWAAAGLYMTGVLYDDLYNYSFSESDEQEADARYEQVIEMYPKSQYSSRAERQLNKSKEGSSQSIAGIIQNEPTSTKAQDNDQAASDARRSCEAKVTGIRYWSNPEYTRVVIDADNETSFQHNLLRKDPANDQLNQRLYVDLKNSRLGNVEKSIPINDDLLESARAGQFTSDTVRVVVDIKSFESYNVFSLQNPFRIVIDVRGKSMDAPPVLHEQKSENVSIARQLALGVKRIAIDAGHGGKDFGAPGFLKGVHEKYVVLEIARKLAAKIQNQLNCEVILTRNSDKYLTLEERTAIANTERADLFISIHANASRNSRASGIETYFLNLTTDDESISVAARENATSRKNISELQSILNDLMQNAKVNESSRLATYVQKSLCTHLAKSYSRVNDKGVKQAPFYVLLGAQMPAVLIETSFISNETECRRLEDNKYQEHICDGIINGIKQYIKETQPSAFLYQPNPGGSGG